MAKKMFSHKNAKRNIVAELALQCNEMQILVVVLCFISVHYIALQCMDMEYSPSPLREFVTRLGDNNRQQIHKN